MLDLSVSNSQCSQVYHKSSMIFSLILVWFPKEPKMLIASQSLSLSVLQSPQGILRYLQMRKGIKFISIPKDLIEISHQEEQKDPRERLHFLISENP